MGGAMCVCGSREVETWKRQEHGRGKAGNLLWFSHCRTCERRHEARSKHGLLELVKGGQRAVQA